MGSLGWDLGGNGDICLPTQPVRRRYLDIQPWSPSVLLVLQVLVRIRLTLTQWLQHQTSSLHRQCSYQKPHRVPTPISTVSTTSSQQKEGLAVFLVLTPVSAPAWKRAVFCWKTPFSLADQEHLQSQTE